MVFFKQSSHLWHALCLSAFTSCLSLRAAPCWMPCYVKGTSTSINPTPVQMSCNSLIMARPLARLWVFTMAGSSARQGCRTSTTFRGSVCRARVKAEFQQSRAEVTCSLGPLNPLQSIGKPSRRCSKSIVSKAECPHQSTTSKSTGPLSALQGLQKLFASTAELGLPAASASAAHKWVTTADQMMQQWADFGESVMTRLKQREQDIEAMVQSSYKQLEEQARESLCAVPAMSDLRLC